MSLLNKLFRRPGDRDDFAKLMLRMFSRAGVKNLLYNKDDFSITVGDGKQRAFLNNIHAIYCSSEKEAREVALKNFVATMVNTPSIPEGFADARPQLLPVVRDPAFKDIFRLRLIAEKEDAEKMRHPSLEIAHGLIALLAYDTPHGILSVNHTSFEKWGVSFKEAMDNARDNLRNITVESGMVQVAPGIFGSHWGDSYDTSRILLTDFIYRLPVHGEPVAFLPNRNMLWITGSLNVAGLRLILQQGVKSHFQQGHPLSPNLYILLDGAWQYYVPEDTTSRVMWQAIRRQRDFLDYRQQKEYLDTIHNGNGDGIFTAKYVTYKRDASANSQNTEEPVVGTSVCIWAKGIDALLPKSENICFICEKEKGCQHTVSWEVAVSIVGSLLEEQPDLAPVRYRVRTFPNDEQLTALRQIPDSFEKFKR